MSERGREKRELGVVVREGRQAEGERREGGWVLSILKQHTTTHDEKRR